MLLTIIMNLAMAAPADVQRSCQLAQTYSTMGALAGVVGAGSAIGTVYTRSANGESTPLSTALLLAGGLSIPIGAMGTAGSFVHRPGCVTSGVGRLLGPAVLISTVGTGVGLFGALMVTADTQGANVVEVFFGRLLGGALLGVGVVASSAGLVMNGVAKGGISVAVIPVSGRRPGLSVTGRW